MANIKFEIDGKVYDFAPESFVIDNEGNIILKSKPSAEKRNPFKRVKDEESFYFISGNGDVMTFKETSSCLAEKYHNCANYCTDAELLTRRALYEKLERCLWRFSMENGGSGEWYICFDRSERTWGVNCLDKGGWVTFGPTFKSYKVALEATEKVIEPLMRGIAEEEIFSWRGD